MSQQELLTKVVEVLEGAGIPYMITGSVASSLQGEPRSTHDIDIIVMIEPSSVKALMEAFPPPDYYLDAARINNAIKKRSMFNLLHIPDGDKVDFWLLTDEPFDVSRFKRRRAEEFHGRRLNISSPEDTILAKLRWAKLSGGSEKQFGDSLSVYEIQYPNLNMDYIEEWAEKLGIKDLWERVKREAEVQDKDIE